MDEGLAMRASERVYRSGGHWCVQGWLGPDGLPVPIATKRVALAIAACANRIEREVARRRRATLTREALERHAAAVGDRS